MSERKKIFELSIKIEGYNTNVFSTKMFLTNKEFEFLTKILVHGLRGLD